MNFKELLMKAKQGDKGAREELFLMYRPMVLSRRTYIRNFLRPLYPVLNSFLLRGLKTSKNKTEFPSYSAVNDRRTSNYESLRRQRVREYSMQRQGYSLFL